MVSSVYPTTSPARRTLVTLAPCLRARTSPGSMRRGLPGLRSVATESARHRKQAALRHVRAANRPASAPHRSPVLRSGREESRRGDRAGGTIRADNGAVGAHPRHHAERGIRISSLGRRNRPGLPVPCASWKPTIEASHSGAGDAPEQADIGSRARGARPAPPSPPARAPTARLSSPSSRRCAPRRPTRRRPSRRASARAGAIPPRDARREPVPR